MKASILKKLFFSIVLLFCSYQGLQLPVVQKAIIKNLIEIFSPYQVKFIEIKSMQSYLGGAIKKLNLAKDEKAIVELEGVTWDVPNLSFREIRLSVEKCTINDQKTPTNFDISTLTPAAIAHILQKIPKSLKRFSAISINSLVVDDKYLKITLNHQKTDWIGSVGDNQEHLDFNLIPAETHSKINFNGLWKGKKLFVAVQISENAIDFSANFDIAKLIGDNIAKTVGEEISFSGRLEKALQWKLSNLKVLTSKRHKLEGQCEQDGDNLKAEFVYELPLQNSQRIAKCAITLEGPATKPTIKWHFTEGIEPIQRAFGECTFIDNNHVKLVGQLYHDQKNQASFDLEIALNPFTVNGETSVAAEDLQKFLHTIWPSAKGNINFHASLKNVTSFDQGTIHIHGGGMISDDTLILPIAVAIDLKNGLGDGFVKLANGSFQNLPLGADIAFKTTKEAIYLEKCEFSFEELRLAIKSQTTYDFIKGLSPTQIEFCGGMVTIERLKFADLENTQLNISISNVLLEKLKSFLKVEDVTGVINGKISKLPQKRLTLNLALTKGYWHRVEKKQVHKILNDLNATVDASFENNDCIWNINIKDQDKINVHSKGQANTLNSLINAHLEGTVRLMLLTEWIASDDRIFGDISFNVHATGAMDSPTFSGYVNADNGLYEHSEVGTFYKNITIRTKASGKRFIITQFDAWDVTKSTSPDHGYLRGEGWIDFSDPSVPIFNIPLHLYHLRIAQHDGFVSDASGTVTITGKGAAVGCQGEVTLEKVHYYLDQSTDTKVPHLIDRSLKKAKEEPAEHYGTAFPLDILVHAPSGSFKVTGLGADTSWEGDFYVKKSISNPFLVGSVTLHEGTLDVLGKVLKLTRGKITFVDDDRNNPRLDIQASKNLGDGLRVAIEIRGTGAHTIVDFTSTPSLPKEEVLALLLFGKKLGEVSVFQSIQLAELAKSDDTSSGFFEKFRNNFGFEQFEFKSATRGGSTSSNDEDKTPQERALEKTSQAVRIGKEFGNVKVAIEQGAGSETSKVVVSTPLGNNFALEGDVGGDQNSGVGVNWVKRY